VGRYEDGIALTRSIVAAQPKYAPAYVLMGEMLMARSQLPQAIEALSTAARLDPKLTLAHLRLAGAYEQQGNLDAALASYRRALDLNPKDARAYNNVAWILASQGKNLDEALSQARKAEELVRADKAQVASLPGVLDTLGFVHYKRGEYAQAEPLLRQAAELSTKDAQIQYHLGLTYHRLGRKADAETWLRRSLQGGGRFAGAEEARQLLKELGG
jgi:Flp pilus assembly protein TadD